MTSSLASVITKKFLLVLALLLGVSLTAFTVFEQLVAGQVPAGLINEAGRQRMLCHRVALFAQILVDPQASQDKQAARAELRQAATALGRTEAVLAAFHDDGAFGLFRPDSDRQQSRRARIGLLTRSLVDDAARLDSLDPTAPEARTLADRMTVLASTVLVDEIEQFMTAFELVSAERAQLLRLFGVAGESLTILLLVFLGLAVFRPLVGEITGRIRQLEYLEGYYHAIISNVGDGVVTLDAQGRVRYANGQFAAMVGCQDGEMVGRPLTDFLAEFEAAADAPGRVEIEYRQASGNTAIYDVSSYHFDFAGRHESILSLRDVTARKDLENRLRLFYHGIEHSPLSIVITDVQGIIQFANRRCVETSGYALGEILGSTPRIFRSGQTAPDTYRALWDDLRAGREWYGEILNRRKSGPLYWEFEAISALRDPAGEITHFIAIKEDITRQKEWAAALLEAKLQADLANRTKSEFLANMSHELRTPLNAVIGFAEVMRRELFGPHAVANYLDYAGAIHDSAQHLLGIINDILDFSKLEAGKATLFEEGVGIAEMIEAVLLIVRERAHGHGVTLAVVNRPDQLATMPGIMVDPLRYKQVLLNILSNAIKFTPSGGTVSIEARHEPDGGATMIIRDTGIGMRTEDFPRALERFGQVDGTLHRKFEGTGLGLPISKALVELHGGQLRLESRPGHGTEVSILLPRHRVVPRTAPAAT